MVKVVLAFNGQQHEIFLDTDEPVEVFRYQIYSVTDVPPERQWISGLGVGYLSNQTQLGSLNIVDGQRVSLIDSVTAPVAPAAAPPGNPMADMMQNLMRMMQPVADWQHVCTRVFLGAELPSAQPRYRYRGIIVCHACATTCCQHDQVAPAADDTAFVCQCCTLNGHECVFEVRAAIGEDILNGNASLTLCSQLAAAGAQQGAQGAAEMAQRIKSHADSVMQFEDPLLLAEARVVVPLEELMKRARERADALPGDDELIRQLLHWFKHEFFQWTNQAPCERCGGGTSHAGMDRPNAEESKYRAGIVELYRCAACNVVTRFPRYNHAGKLMKTKRGRCGEWAQAFVLAAKSIGFEVRTALDFTDHVWAEIWSECQQRWVHCDPCENCFDGPLMYEGGWGKKLTYVIAASADECVDVTRRYTAKFEAEVLGRRTLCGEGALKSIIQRTNENCLQRVARTATAARLDEIKDRQVREQQELTNGLNRDEKRELQPHERIGRITGSVDWRLARGELGTGAAAAAAIAGSIPAASPPVPANEPQSAPSQKRPPRAQGPKANVLTSVLNGMVNAVDRTAAAAKFQKLVEIKYPELAADILASFTTCSEEELLEIFDMTDEDQRDARILEMARLRHKCDKAPVDSTAQAATPAAPAAAAAPLSKPELAALVKLYFTQLTKGCGRDSCPNPHCHSNVERAANAQTPTALAKEAVSLAVSLQRSGLCEQK